jgi:hypothetical protein
MNAAYQNTRFRIRDAKQILEDRFAIVTAYNPHGRIAALKFNEEADARLSSRLRDMKCRCWRITGRSADFSHAEPGFAAELPLSTALVLGREFKQEAIFWVEKDSLSVITCGDDDRIALGSFRKRISRIAPVGKKA